MNCSTVRSDTTVTDMSVAVGDAPEPATPLESPREGVPEVVTTAAAVETAAKALRAGTGPTAVDAERASGYRYGHSAYLVQLRRAGSGTHLIDPTGCRNLSAINLAIGDSEWILHAANQDLPCLADVGLRPRTIFDTEIAGRILGKPRVGLASLVEAELGYHLAKEHSAADWSTRPLPASWLSYAALDVELLIELRERLFQQLIDSGRLDWAAEEFAHVLSAPPRPSPAEPWRRTSGINRARTPRQIAIVRSLWQERDDLAARLDRAPGRVLPDKAIIAAAVSAPSSPSALAALPEFSGRGTRRRIDLWWASVRDALSLADSDLPAARAPATGIPAARSWAPQYPKAAARLALARAGIARISDELRIPAENLLTPDTVRQLCWEPPQPLTRDSVAARLTELGARSWQVDLCGDVIYESLAST